MKLDFKLDFLYYQQKYFLDGSDPMNETFWNDKIKFAEFLNSEKLPKIIRLLVMAYKEKYCDPLIWEVDLSKKDVHEKRLEPPFAITESDLYMSGKQMYRDDIEYMITYMYEIEDDEKGDFDYLKKMEIVFNTPQPNIAPEIEAELEDVQYQKSVMDSTTIYSFSDSPILEICLSSKAFVLIINPDKWEGRF